MLFVILFEDNEDKADMRGRFMNDHLAFLEAHADSVREAGPLSDGGTGAPSGGMWIVAADNGDQARALVEADPFWPTGLRKSVRILAWGRVFADGARLMDT